MDFSLNPAVVRIPLNQHVGTPAEPVVKPGDAVNKYDLIGKSSGKISSDIHASIDGKVISINKNEIVIQRN
jgi:electron transport complex protein RnfC